MTRRGGGERQGGRLLTTALVVAFVLAVALAVAGVVGVVRASAPDPGPVATDMRGDPVRLDPEASIPPPERSDPVADTGGRLRIPSVGLDVALGALNEVDGQITPPGFATAYRVRDRGVAPGDAEEGTVYVVMHALRGGAIGPGNYVTDIDTATSTLAPGDEIDVDGVAYRVTGWRTVDKDALPADPLIWDGARPGRLVLITCLERPGGPSIQNMVITAVRP